MFLCVCVTRANSVAWNPHKMLVAGLQCSTLLLRDTTVRFHTLRIKYYLIHILTFSMVSAFKKIDLVIHFLFLRIC